MNNKNFTLIFLLFFSVFQINAQQIFLTNINATNCINMGLPSNPAYVKNLSLVISGGVGNYSYKFNNLSDNFEFSFPFLVDSHGPGSGAVHGSTLERNKKYVYWVIDNNAYTNTSNTNNFSKKYTIVTNDCGQPANIFEAIDIVNVNIPSSCNNNSKNVTWQVIGGSGNYEIGWGSNPTTWYPFGTGSNIPCNNSWTMVVRDANNTNNNYTKINVNTNGSGSAGNYSISYINSAGSNCNISSPTITNPNNSITQGGSVTLNSTACTSGTKIWSNGATTSSITVSPTVTSNYSVKCNLNGCNSPESNVATINVSSSTGLTIFNTSVSGCNNNQKEARWSVSGGSGNYQVGWGTSPTTWYTNYGVTNIPENNTWSMVVKDTQPPYATKSFTIVANSCNNSGYFQIGSGSRIGVDEETTPAENLKVFPNPIKNELNILVSENLKNIKLFDLSGRVKNNIENLPLNTKTFKIDVSNLEKGIYFINVTTSKFNKTQKIIKE